MIPEDLEKQIEIAKASGGVPFFVSATGKMLLKRGIELKAKANVSLTRWYYCTGNF